MIIQVTTAFTGTATGSTDRDFWLPASPISGGPDGFEVIGAIELEYTATGGPGVMFEYEPTTGEAARGGWLPNTQAGEVRFMQIPVYSTHTWPQQQQHQIRLTFAAAHQDATIYRIQGEVTLKRAGQILA